MVGFLGDGTLLQTPTFIKLFWVNGPPEEETGGRGAGWGVIGEHALCIISHREEDGAASGSESSEVKAANTDEGAALAARNT